VTQPNTVYTAGYLPKTNGKAATGLNTSLIQYKGRPINVHSSIIKIAHKLDPFVIDVTTNDGRKFKASSPQIIDRLLVEGWDPREEATWDVESPQVTEMRGHVVCKECRHMTGICEHVIDYIMQVKDAGLLTGSGGLTFVPIYREVNIPGINKPRPFVVEVQVGLPDDHGYSPVEMVGLGQGYEVKLIDLISPYEGRRSIRNMILAGLDNLLETDPNPVVKPDLISEKCCGAGHDRRFDYKYDGDKPLQHMLAYLLWFKERCPRCHIMEEEEAMVPL
jgi:hypothetical protein